MNNKIKKIIMYFIVIIVLISFYFLFKNINPKNVVKIGECYYIQTYYDIIHLEDCKNKNHKQNGSNRKNE